MRGCNATCAVWLRSLVAFQAGQGGRKVKEYLQAMGKGPCLPSAVQTVFQGLGDSKQRT